MSNTATARALTTLLAKLAKGEVVSPVASRKMVDILLEQTHRDCLPALLPSEAKVANKPGWNDGICHDAGIVYPPNRAPYVLSVLTEGAASHEEAVRLIGEISKVVYEGAR